MEIVANSISLNQSEPDLNSSSDSTLVKSDSDADDELNSGVCDPEEELEEFEMSLKELKLEEPVDSDPEEETEEMYDTLDAEAPTEVPLADISTTGGTEGEQYSPVRDIKSPDRPHSTPARRPVHLRSLMRKGSDLNMEIFPIFSRPATESTTPAKQSQLRSPRTKYSSTSTLFVNDSLSKPDLEEVLRNLAKALFFHIEKGCNMRNKIYYNIFNEEIYPLTEEPDLDNKPDEITIHTFLKGIFDFQKMDVECAIMSLIYVERLLELTKMTIDATNWRRVLLGSLIIASKVWEDLAVWNQDFLSVFNNSVPVADFNELELKFLYLTQYKLTISASAYAKYFFHLRMYSHKERNLPLKPLNKEKLKLLSTQVESKTHNEKLHNLSLPRSVSLDNIKPVHVSSQAVINWSDQIPMHL